MPRDRIELPTRGFSVLANPSNVMKLHRRGAGEGAAMSVPRADLDRVVRQLGALVALRGSEQPGALVLEALDAGLEKLIVEAATRRR